MTDDANKESYLAHGATIEFGSTSTGMYLTPPVVLNKVPSAVVEPKPAKTSK